MIRPFITGAGGLKPLRWLLTGCLLLLMAAPGFAHGTDITARVSLAPAGGALQVELEDPDHNPMAGQELRAAMAGPGEPPTATAWTDLQEVETGVYRGTLAAPPGDAVVHVSLGFATSTWLARVPVPADGALDKVSVTFEPAAGAQAGAAAPAAKPAPADAAAGEASEGGVPWWAAAVVVAGGAILALAVRRLRPQRAR